MDNQSICLAQFAIFAFVFKCCDLQRPPDDGVPEDCNYASTESLSVL